MPRLSRKQRHGAVPTMADESTRDRGKGIRRNRLADLWEDSVGTRVGAAGGEQYSVSGATLQPRYHDREHDVVSMDVNELRDMGNASHEEFMQFVAGEFLMAGAFWLGVERFVTVESWQVDLLFWICVVSFVAGGVIAWFGYRQLRRRQKRIETIITSAKKRNVDHT